MSFSSLIFIALFLPVFMIASVLVRGNQRKNLLLLLFSLIFYARTSIKFIVGKYRGRSIIQVRFYSDPIS